MHCTRLFIIDVTILTLAGLAALLSLICFATTVHWMIHAAKECEGCAVDIEQFCLACGAPTVPKFVAIGCGCSLAAFVIGALRLHVEKVGRHKHSRIAYIALLTSGSLSMLIALVIWGDTATHTSAAMIDQSRLGLLRKYLRQMNANVYENRTALIHIVSEHVTAIRNHLTDAFIRKRYQDVYLSWPFGVAVAAEVFLFIANVLYLSRKDFKVAPQQFSV